MGQSGPRRTNAVRLLERSSMTSARRISGRSPAEGQKDLSMTPGSHRFVKTARAILGLMALATATVWIALFLFVKPAKGETVDARKLYVIDGDTIALARERIRLLSIDAPETRDARCEREREAGYATKARVVDLLRFGRVVDIRRQGHDQ